MGSIFFPLKEAHMGSIFFPLKVAPMRIENNFKVHLIGMPKLKYANISVF